MTSSPSLNSPWSIIGGNDNDNMTIHEHNNNPSHHYFGDGLISPGVPESIGTARSTGSGLAAAREDHVHDLPASVITAQLTFASLALRNASTPTVGEICSVHSSDNNEGIYEYTSAATWRQPWNMPWGYITSGSQSTVSNSGTSGTYNSIGLTATWTAVTNRVYLISMLATRVDVGGGDVQTAAWHTGGGTFIETAAVIVNLTGVGMGYPVPCHLLYFPTSGSITIELKAMSSSATPGIWQSGGNITKILVQDIGNNGAPT